MQTTNGKNFIIGYFRQQIALTHRNYRLFLLGQGMSVTGTWIQRIAMIWLAYRLTNSPFILGVVGFSEQIPIFIIAPFAGVFADRWNKQHALIKIESFAMIQAVLMSVLTLMHVIKIWHIILLSLLLGVINSFEVPVRQSFVVDMVDGDKNALGNAIALNSTVFNLSQLIGPSLAGILISVAGEGWCFMANALSYAIVVASLILMHISTKPLEARRNRQVIKELREGVHYVKDHLTMRSLLFLLAIISFSNASFRILGPVFAKNILHGNANTFGFLMSAAGVGAIIGAIYLTNHRSTKLLKRLIHYTGLLLGASLLCFGWSKWLLLSLFFMAIGGLAQMVHTASTNTLLQFYTDDDKRGRVMSFYAMSLQGMTPFGSLVAGAIAGAIGGPWAIAIMGVICIAGTFLLRDKNDREIKAKNRWIFRSYKKVE
ncbi:MAG: MFS transporter [Chitinophagaceae bacterium]|nr:MAG: MFS transporter [Chitinophagaceae bacterium]